MYYLEVFCKIFVYPGLLTAICILLSVIFYGKHYGDKEENDRETEEKR